MVSRTVSPDYHDRIVQTCLQAGFYPDIRYELQHWLSVASLVSQGMGVALVPQALQKSAIPGAVFKALEPAKDASTPAPYETHCLWKTHRADAALAAFVGAVKDSLT